MSSGCSCSCFGGLATASATRKRAGDEPTRLLAQALLAAIATHVVTLATYDALVFPTTGMSLFLIIGCTGALWRFTRLAHPGRGTRQRSAGAGHGGPGNR